MGSLLYFWRASRKEPAAAALEEQGMGWKNKCGKGHSEDTVTSGLEGAWTANPTQWSMQYLQFLYAYEWKQSKISTPFKSENPPSILINITNSLNDVNNMDLFINGYLKNEGIDDLYIPVDIMNIIKKMIVDQSFHILKHDYQNVDKTNHYCIDFDKLF